MRATKDPEFCEYLMRIGDGKEKTNDHGKIEIPHSLIIPFTSEKESLTLENQVQATIYSTDITYFEKEFAPFKTYLDPLPPPTRLALTTFDTFEYQPKEFEFDVLAIVINSSPSTKTTTGKRIQEFIVMDKLKKHYPSKMGKRISKHGNEKSSHEKELKAFDVAMWMPYVPVLLRKLKIFSPIIAAPKR
ncbi:hypothetical protein KY289_030037 [Solanum tuberosum]|nr:hypothetical protein KY289_030037 [Solanum tuberosum]